jgi:hypothetical protein
MPDDDRFPRYLSPAWGKVLRCLQGHDPVERVGDAVTKAVAATIRTVHWIPSLPSLAEKMREAASRGDSAVMTAALAGDPLAKLAARFASRPTGEGLRAPARRGPKPTLKSLLNTDLESL